MKFNSIKPKKDRILILFKINPVDPFKKRYFISLIMALFFVFLISNVKAQSEKVITGQITDFKTHKPIEGASVSLMGTKYATISDENG
ncbi:MAG TPA: hypothetical protein VF270_00525, partial [Ignavibacteriaceae bacterium]